MKKKKKIIVSVTNDLSYDQRVHKICTYLTEKDFEVVLIGRKLKESKSILRSYETKRMKLIFSKGALFYAEFNIRLFFYLIFSKADIQVSNDLDTLLANYLAKKVTRRELVYDSHEYFTEVPEIQNRKFVKKTWEAIEKWIFPKLNNIITVNDSISKIYSEKYNKEVVVVRNISEPEINITVKSREELQLPINDFLLLIQGSGINIDRGGEEALESLRFLPENVKLLFVGNGDAIPTLKSKASELSLEQRVIFIPKVPYADLFHYTSNCNLGLTLDKSSNLNYKYSLPNKVFDYIYAGIPILSSNVIEVARIVNDYKVGEVIDNVDSNMISNTVIKLINDKEKLSYYKSNTILASKELTWDNEKKNLDKIYNKLI